MSQATGTDTLHMGYNLDKTSTSVLNFPVSKPEADILDAASFIKFGELLQIEVNPVAPRQEKAISSQQKAFIDVLRQENVTFLHAVVVHNGCPTQIEIEGKFGEIKYRRKIRFN